MLKFYFFLNCVAFISLVLVNQVFLYKLNDDYLRELLDLYQNDYVQVNTCIF